MIETTSTPDWVSHPGETIEDLLEEKGWTQVEFAERTGFTKKHVNALLHGRASITPRTAILLESVLGSTADFWLTRELRYREATERKRNLADLESDVDWLKELPVSDMVRLGWISKMSSKAEQVAECLRFFGVASVEAWRTSYRDPLVVFRASTKFEKRVGAVAAWLRQAEREAGKISCRPFSKGQFRSVLPDLRKLASESDPKKFVDRLVAQCAAVGVAVVFVPTVTGCPASGATQWLSPDKAMLILSLRHKTNDHLWFSFFHEAGHILLHSKKRTFVDLENDRDGSMEREADQFAADVLVPPAQAHVLEKLKGVCVSKVAVVEAAEAIGIAPGIVVGRLQKERVIPWSHMNGLKVRYDWSNGGA